MDDPVSAASAVASLAAATCLLGAPCGRRMPQVHSKLSIKLASRLSLCRGTSRDPPRREASPCWRLQRKG